MSGRLETSNGHAGICPTSHKAGRRVTVQQDEDEMGEAQVEGSIRRYPQGGLEWSKSAESTSSGFLHWPAGVSGIALCLCGPEMRCNLLYLGGS